MRILHCLEPAACIEKRVLEIIKKVLGRRGNEIIVSTLSISTPIPLYPSYSICIIRWLVVHWNGSANAFKAIPTLMGQQAV